MIGIHKRTSRIKATTVIGLTYCFLYLPIVVLVIFSFNSKTFPAPWESFTLQWYAKLFYNKELWISFANSFIVAGASTSLCLGMAILMLFSQVMSGSAHKQNQSSSNSISSLMQKIYMPLFYGNLVIPETVLAVGLLSYFTMLHVPLGLMTLIISHSLLGLGFVIPLLYVRYRELDPRLIEASLVLGASSLQTFRRIILPLMLPSLIAAGLMIFVISFDDFILSYFCSGTSVQTLSLFLVSSLRYGISPEVNALGFLLLLITTSLVFVLVSLKSKARIF